MYNLAREVGKLTPEQRIDLASKCLAVKIESGDAYSITNQCLIARQIPNATICGGFSQWIKAGRVVKKGEHGACVWVPCKRKAKATDEATSSDEAAAIRTGFILGTVFDVAQTTEKGAVERSEEPTTNERANVLEMAA